MDLSPLAAHCANIGQPLSVAQSAALLAYLEILYDENVRANITRVPRDEAVVRHLIDSALVLDMIPPGAHCLDIGSGPGLPGFVIACCRPDTRVTCLESTEKMTRPLARAQLSNLRVRIHRAEDVDNRESFDFVTGRAVAPLMTQLEVSAAWCRVGGLVVPFRTQAEAHDIENLDASPLGLVLERAESRPLLGTGAVRLFPIYKKTRKTPRDYPRRWGEIKKRPLGA